jgi:hypothetical protein
MLYLSFLITTLTAIMTIPNDYLLGILNAPTVESLKDSGVQQVGHMVSSGVRRLSNAANAVGAAVRRASAARPTIRGAAHLPQRQTVMGRMSGMLGIGGIAVQANRAIPEAVLDVRNQAGKSLTEIAANSRALQEQSTSKALALKTRSTRLSMAQNVSVKELLDSSVHESNSESGSYSFEGDSVRDVAPTTGAADIESRGEDGAALMAAAPLLEEVLLQRAVLRDGAEQTVQFDAQWGVKRRRNADRTLGLDRRTRLAIAEDVVYADEEAAELKSTVAKYSAQHAGLEILHLFMVDLLGRSTPAAKIFREKFGEDFEDTRAVTRAGKVMAALVLVCLNVFFVFYLILKGYQKGPKWQVQFFLSCVAQILVELLVFETTECLWLNYTIPSFVHTEVAQAADVLRLLVERIAGAGKITAATSRMYFLNAPAHLFVSVKLAREFPQLLESVIVTSYSNHLPGRRSETWPHYVKASAVKQAEQSERDTLSWMRAIVISAVALSAVVVQWVITVPFLYQRIVIRFAQPLIFSGVTLVWYLVSNSTVALVLLSAFTAAGLLLLARWHMRMYAKSHAISRIVPISGGAEVGGNLDGDLHAPAQSPFLDDQDEDGAGLNEKLLSQSRSSNSGSRSSGTRTRSSQSGHSFSGVSSQSEEASYALFEDDADSGAEEAEGSQLELGSRGSDEGSGGSEYDEEQDKAQEALGRGSFPSYEDSDSALEAQDKDQPPRSRGRFQSYEGSGSETSQAAAEETGDWEDSNTSARFFASQDEEEGAGAEEEDSGEGLEESAEQEVYRHSGSQASWSGSDSGASLSIRSSSADQDLGPALPQHRTRPRSSTEGGDAESEEEQEEWGRRRAQSSAYEEDGDDGW